MAEWIDLLDPDEAQLREHAPRDLDPTVLERLLEPADPEGRSRPTFQGHGDSSRYSTPSVIVSSTRRWTS